MLHGITNADIDALCLHASLPAPKKRKKMAQLSVRVFLNVSRVIIVSGVAAALYYAALYAAALASYATS